MAEGGNSGEQHDHTAKKKWRTKEHSHKKPSVITILFKNKELLPDCTNVEEYDVRHRIS